MFSVQLLNSLYLFDNIALSIEYSSIKDIPPPLPFVIYTGTPDIDRVSISLYMVLVETSNLSANSLAVTNFYLIELLLFLLIYLFSFITTY